MEHDPHHRERRTPELSTGTSVRTKPGVWGYPWAAPGAAELARHVAPFGGVAEASSVFLDAAGAAGALAAAVLDAARETDRASSGTAAWEPFRISVLEPSAAALRCARERLGAEPTVRLEAGWIGDAEAGSVDAVALLPPAERGTARVHAELAAAARALRPGGQAWLALHKDRGAKRYLKDAGRWFGVVETVDRAKGWRVARLARPVDAARADASAVPWTEFDAMGHRLAALPGVFAAGKLDPGTSVLLRVLDELRVGEGLADGRVLDLGCGYGPLALWAAAAGADVVAVDDDVLAVRCVRRNAERLGLRIDARHSDLDAALGPDERFAGVLCNPPFHVGKEVRHDLSSAFVRAAHRRLQPSGELWMVANRALPYERDLGGWSHVDTLAVDGGFKVIRARP